jgi:uncharacterized surface protein with fasciclin (FAS1) repeats
MRKTKIQKLTAVLLTAMLLLGSFAGLASAAVESAPLSLTADEVTGTIPGGQFAKLWLGLDVTQPNANVTISTEWDRYDALASGLGFYILSPENLARVQGGNDIRDNNTASGGAVFQGPTNQQIASFNATGSDYTLVIYNDSNSDATFTTRATNALISDDSGQVTSTKAVEETQVPAAPAAAVATAIPAPATTTTTTTTAVTATTAVAAPVTAPATSPAVAAPSTEVKAKELKGSLPNEGDQHFLGLEPTVKDGEVNLILTFDPQDNTELARRIGFWVLDQQGFQRYTQGTPASELAIAAGSRTFLGSSNERTATFNSTGFGPYTVIVYNSSSVPATYNLRVDGGLLVDDSGQTETARASAPVTTTVTTTTAPVAATTATTPTATTPVATTTTTPAATAATTAAATGAVGTPGGRHTIRSGDSLSALARDIYGDIQLYDEICKFNNLANCDLVEVGDVIQLPTLAQINAGATAPAAPAAAAPAAAATTTTKVTTTTPAASTAVTTTSSVTTTTTTTRTTSATTPTTSATKPTTSTATTTAGATGSNLVATAEAAGNFTILVKALKATGLDKTLAGAGPFTVFAPTDAAFEALGSATVDALLKDTKQLAQILQFHVVQNSSIASSSITNGLEATTVLGSPVEFTVAGKNVKVQDSNVIVPDVAASNGVIHAIDKVMLPPAP